MIKNTKDWHMITESKTRHPNPIRNNLEPRSYGPGADLIIISLRQIIDIVSNEPFNRCKVTVTKSLALDYLGFIVNAGSRRPETRLTQI